MNETTKRKHPPGGYGTREPVEQVMTDDQKNNMFAINNGRTIEIYTLLFGENDRRYVGTVDIQQKILTVKRKRGIHLHRKTNSYGFNYHVITTGQTFDRVQIIDDFGTYIVPVIVIQQQGKILNFGKQGFEKQIFVPLEVITAYPSKAII